MKQEYTNIVCGLLGSGKTGSFVAQNSPFQMEIFNTQNPPSKQKLNQCDIIISFLPPDAFLEYLELLKNLSVPIVCGTTGIQWPKNLTKELKSPWIIASNFSLGMALIKKAISSLSFLDKIEEDVKFSIEETHHKNKIDNPSGTALTWAKWLGKKDISVKGHRIDDQVGTHILKIETPYEEIELKHKSLSRALFAQGALYAAKYLLNNTLEHGLYDFHDIVEKDLL